MTNELGPNRRRVKVTIEMNVNDLKLPETGVTGSWETVKNAEGEAWGLITTLEGMGYEPGEVEITVEDLGEIK